ncbi:MAG: hypothetical protein EGR15_03300 [Lachnospiraceae bacterium]|nr:hypothetical protein [Lachnospiraceae bacterium]
MVPQPRNCSHRPHDGRTNSGFADGSTR